MSNNNNNNNKNNNNNNNNKQCKLCASNNDNIYTKLNNIVVEQYMLHCICELFNIIYIYFLLKFF